MNILITGGASGLGEPISKKAAAGGSHSVYFTYHDSEAAAKEIEATFPNAKAIRCNFRDTEDVDRLAKKIPELDLEVLVNNALAGKININHFHKTDVSVFRDGFLDNILPVVRITQAAINHFRKKKFGKIITVLTAHLVNRPPIGLSEYVAAKAYLASLCKSWAIENSPFNVTSNCVSPSFMQTGLTRDTDERIVEQMMTHHPQQKLLTPGEAADAILFLIHASQQINGVNLIINAAADVV